MNFSIHVYFLVASLDESFLHLKFLLIYTWPVQSKAQIVNLIIEEIWYELKIQIRQFWTAGNSVKACSTVDGRACLFPFRYLGKTWDLDSRDDVALIIKIIGCG